MLRYVTDCFSTYSMCGIAVCICSDVVSETILKTSEWSCMWDNVSRRGPDFQHREQLHIVDSDSDICLTFFVSTLHLRGLNPIMQPHTSDRGIFCWNGEVFEGLDISPDQNDGSVLFAALDNLREEKELYHLIGEIEGPYAFVYYRKRSQVLYFARDPLGRRSLLVHYPTERHPFFSLSSVSMDLGYDCTFEEVDPRFIYSIDLSQPSSFGSSFSGTVLQPKIVRQDRAIYCRQFSFATVLPVNHSIPKGLPLPNVDSLPEDLMNTVNSLHNILDRSVYTQVKNIPRSNTFDGSRVAILFSGGIDSTIIAFLTHRHIPLEEPIDLLNVAFENPRRIQSKVVHDIKKDNSNGRRPASPMNGGDIYNVPDRLSGLEELDELRRLCPNRQWNFVEINIPYTESSQAKEMVQYIMHPSKTVMDLSLGLALYFSSKGSGVLKKSGQVFPYVSPAKVLLNGLGADELLGGYARHRSAFKTGGWLELVKQLQLELDLIPNRNLGRDDRVVSHHGKEVRHPFLSLSVANFISSLPVHLKTDPRLELGVGDKLLLRLLAKKLGLDLVSTRKKRAMQFGSCSARMESSIGANDGGRPLECMK